MSRIAEKFKKGKALITFITAGDPDLSTTEALIFELEKRGADIIELGIPFSDSIADGPTIQSAYQRALKTTAADVLGLVNKIREKSELPIVLMGSYNLIYNYGIEKFFEEAAKARVDGVIAPDLPPEEARELREQAKKHKVDLIFLVAPTSTPERIKLAAEASTGFIYLISLLGITGARAELSSTVQDSLKKIRKYTAKPVAVGFGISTPEQARAIAEYADGVIVGSAIVDIIAKNLGKPDLVKKVGDFIESLM